LRAAMRATRSRLSRATCNSSAQTFPRLAPGKRSAMRCSSATSVAAIFFLATLETRLKRREALARLHELRSIVHVIDMHQLTKDPSVTVGAGRATASSPERRMSPFELSRYLDYCSEMLSLTAKLAALYAQGSKDPVVIDAASDIGQITTNLASKIWQKITLVQQMSLAPAAPRSSIPPG